MTGFALRYCGPPAAPARLPAALEDALYDLGDAGARAVLEIGDYRLELDGRALVTTIRACRALVAALASGVTSEQDERLRAALPGVAPGAHLHSWLVSDDLQWLPVIVFATTEGETCVVTRTHAEAEGWPLVVLEGRDRVEPTCVATTDVVAQAQSFIAAAEADARGAAGHDR